MERVAVRAIGGLCLVLAVWLCPGPAGAATAVYTNEAAFLEAVGNLPIFLNELTNFGYQGWLAHPIKATSNGISYQIASEPPVHLVAFAGAVSTRSTNDGMIVSFTSENVTGTGGYFYAADADAAPVSGTVTMSLSDGTVTNVTSSAGQPPPFIGFLSDGPLLQFLTITNASGDAYPALAHFYAIDPVPSPSIASTGAGGLLISWSAASTGLVLEASEGVSGTVWTNVDLKPQTVSNQFQVALPISGRAGFFRLKKP